MVLVKVQCTGRTRNFEVRMNTSGTNAKIPSDYRRLMDLNSRSSLAEELVKASFTCKKLYFLLEKAFFLLAEELVKTSQ